MRGLPSIEIPSTPSSVSEYLSHFQFRTPHDETDRSGLQPLLFAAMSGNVAVVKDLITRERVNVKARVRRNLPKFGIEKGMDTLSCALATCPRGAVHEIVSFLLEAGSDPNLTFPKSGGTPLMSAVTWNNLEGVKALVQIAGNKLDLEKGLKVNNATALLVAGNVGSFEVVKALVEAGANRKHK